MRILALAAALLHAAPAPGELPAARMYQTVQVAEGVYAFISPESNSGVVTGNSLVVIGEDAVLVVDTGQFPTLARRMAAEIRRKTDRPVRYIVHTHWHPDHVLGDDEFRKAYPGVVIVSTGFTRRKISEEPPKWMAVIAEKGPEFLQGTEAALARGTRRDGTPLTEADRKAFEAQARDLPLLMSEYAQAKLVVPDLTFEDRLTLSLGKREVRVLFLGRGNTAGDAVVVVPDSRVVATGDLVVAPVPYAFGSYPGDWIETLGKLTALDAAIIVPGHGPVMRDWVYARQIPPLLESLRAQVAAAARQGKSLEEARGQLDLEKFRKQFAGGNLEREAAFDSFFVGPAVDRAFQEAAGSFKEESGVPE